MFLSLRKLAQITGFPPQRIKARLNAAEVRRKGKGMSLAYESVAAMKAIYGESEAHSEVTSRSRL